MINLQINALTDLINVLITKHELDWAKELLTSIPGIGATGAENILAETGVDMRAFETSAHLTSWAGVCPGQYESAGKSRSGKTRPGNTYLRGALGIAAMAASRTNGSFFQARYRKLAARRGPMRALVAIEHSMLTAIWHMLTNQASYQDHSLEHARHPAGQPSHTPNSHNADGSDPDARNDTGTLTAPTQHHIFVSGNRRATRDAHVPDGPSAQRSADRARRHAIGAGRLTVGGLWGLPGGCSRALYGAMVVVARTISSPVSRSCRASREGSAIRSTRS